MPQRKQAKPKSGKGAGGERIGLPEPARRDRAKNDQNFTRTAGVAEMTNGNQTKCGPTTGGTSVEIFGGPWDEETIMFTTVMFGEYAATNVDVGDEEKTRDDYKTYKSIKATSPPQKAGTVSITVITPGKDPKKKTTLLTLST